MEHVPTRFFNKQKSGLFASRNAPLSSRKNALEVRYRFHFRSERVWQSDMKSVYIVPFSLHIGLELHRHTLLCTAEDVLLFHKLFHKSVLDESTTRTRIRLFTRAWGPLAYWISFRPLSERLHLKMQNMYEAYRIGSLVCKIEGYTDMKKIRYEMK